MWSNGVWKNRESDEEQDRDCDKEEFQVTRGKFDRDRGGSREAVGIKYCSINI